MSNKDSNIVKFPQKSDEEKQLDTLNKQFKEIETQSDMIEQQRLRIEALERAKDRLGTNASKVTWIVSNIIDFKPEKNYDVWHDRAAFHFLTKENDIKTYVSTTEKYVSKNLIIGTFSNDGPLKCSGLEITQYSRNKMQETFNSKFELVKSLIKNHQTPFDTIQNFIFCSFKKR